jgi:hypothetical protein
LGDETVKKRTFAMNYLAGIAISASAGLFALVSPALAIECVEGYQRVKGDLIATPYCQDGYLARVAGEFGMRAPADKIRNNPNFKREVCRLVGQDIRVQSICTDELPHGRSGRF